MMTAAELLDELAQRGAKIHVFDDGRVGVAPASVLTGPLREAIRRVKAEIVEQVKGSDLAQAPLIEARTDIAAVRIRTRGFGEIWLARNDEVAAELATERDGRPILLFEEVPFLRDKSPEMIRAVLEVRRSFPGGRILQ